MNPRSGVPPGRTQFDSGNGNEKDAAGKGAPGKEAPIKEETAGGNSAAKKAPIKQASAKRRRVSVRDSDATAAKRKQHFQTGPALPSQVVIEGGKPCMGCSEAKVKCDGKVPCGDPLL